MNTEHLRNMAKGMTEYVKTPMDLAFEALAVNDESYLDLPALAELLTAYVDATFQERRDFLLSLEVCPIHLCATEICADDDVQECREFWQRPTITPTDTQLGGPA